MSRFMVFSLHILSPQRSPTLTKPRQPSREKLCDDQVSNFFVGKMSGSGSDLTISMTLRLATDISVSK
jgi:hypothetical protein